MSIFRHDDKFHQQARNTFATMQIQPSDLSRVREDFFLRGESVADWARNHAFPVNAVYQVLNGHCQARRGRSHQIAVALGLKAQPSVISAEQVKERIM
ncbi:DNA-binding protein [Roseateles sp. BYS87W]|uniref:DNA-binding protein n=1 Tax=Pelomonas baiyunensis TaxID=3299026 RepID=A0ABW7H1X2_9BURK